MICSRLTASAARTSNLSNIGHRAPVTPRKHHADKYFIVVRFAVRWSTLRGPDALGKFLFILRKKSVINSLRQVRPVIFRSTKFCQGLPNFKDAAVLPRSRTNFCQAWNLTDLSIYTPWIEGKCQSRKFDLIFSRSISVRSPPKLDLCLRGNPTINLEDSYLGMLHDDPFAQYNYYGS